MATGCYMLDFSVFRPPETWRMNREESWKNGTGWKDFVQEKSEFMDKVFSKSGIDPNGTFLPPWVNPSVSNEYTSDMRTSMAEAEAVMTGSVGDVLARTGVNPEDIDILVTNCSIFCPTPSLGSMLINKFKFRPDVQMYHLGGMGCSIGVVAVGLVRDMLKAHPNSIALMVPCEVTSYCYYPGRNKDYLVSNVIFRSGGAAMLMTNKPSLYSRCKYELHSSTRVHTGQDDTAYKCISWGPDEEGFNGVYLGKDVPVQAGKMLEAVIAKATPKILTWRQYATAAVNIIGRKLLGMQWPRYAPDYTRCIEHFALHAGGYAVLKGIQKGMNLPMEMMMPSFASLRDYGNTSSSTTWYSMAYMERFGMVKQGQRIMQVGAGGGMKGGVNVWHALRDTETPHKAWMHIGRAYAGPDFPRAIEDSEHRPPPPPNAHAKAPAGPSCLTTTAEVAAPPRPTGRRWRCEPNPPPSPARPRARPQAGRGCTGLPSQTLRKLRRARHVA
ncbi:MAG: FAE1/Type III polyketide synthase-like protein-domain-containing protein [Monoraphidium minutum]|nr:MAG: FAE1/Type III polyketide synthase-like protein-domain-containing protein [Monoraphidium minutum]